MINPHKSFINAVNENYEIPVITEVIIQNPFNLKSMDFKKETIIDIKAREQGIEQGEKRKAIKTARNVLNKGISIEIIAECTGLTHDEIEELHD